MNKYIKSACRWVEEHKKEIAITGAIAIASAVGGYILHDRIELIKVANLVSKNAENWNPPKLDISDTSVDSNVRHHDGAIEISLYDDIPLTGLGALGRYLAESIPDLPDDPSTVYLEMVIPIDEAT